MPAARPCALLGRSSLVHPIAYAPDIGIGTCVVFHFDRDAGLRVARHGDEVVCTIRGRATGNQLLKSADVETAEIIVTNKLAVQVLRDGHALDGIGEPAAGRRLRYPGYRPHVSHHHLRRVERETAEKW